MSEPQERRTAKDIICAIIQEAGGTLCGTTRLYKAFYVAHLYYWLHSEGVLTDHPIVRMPRGPGIDNGLCLLAELCEEGRINAHEAPSGIHLERVYTLAKGGKVRLEKGQKQAIREALKVVSGKTAAGLSDMVKAMSASLKMVPEGSEIPLYLDVLDEADLEGIDQQLREAGELVDKVFK